MAKHQGRVFATLAIGMAAFSVAGAQAAQVAKRYFVTNVISYDPLGSVGINDHGQLVTTTFNVRGEVPLLWSPSAPNQVDGTGVTISMSVVSPPDPFGQGGTIIVSGRATDVNNAGQISGTLSAGVSGAFLFTPTSADEATGTTTRLTTNTNSGGYRVNAYGQVGIVASSSHGSYDVAELFTPGSANSAAGTVTTIPGGAATVALNDRGDAVGYTVNGGFVFRPTADHGTTGAVLSLGERVLAINNNGLVGTPTSVLRLSDGPTPVAIETHVIGKSVSAINDAGVAVTSNGAAWTATDGLIDLNTRIEPHSGSGITIQRAVDINATGQIAAVGLIDADGDPTTTQLKQIVTLLTPLTDGDATIDQHVDFADVLALAKNYGSTAGKTWRDGDFTGEGAVAFDDLLLLAKHYDAGTPTSLADETSERFAADWSLAQSLVPEPVTLLSALALASVGIARCRRH